MDFHIQVHTRVWGGGVGEREASSPTSKDLARSQGFTTCRPRPVARGGGGGVGGGGSDAPPQLPIPKILFHPLLALAKPMQSVRDRDRPITPPPLDLECG